MRTFWADRSLSGPRLAEVLRYASRRAERPMQAGITSNFLAHRDGSTIKRRRCIFAPRGPPLEGKTKTTARASAATAALPALAHHPGQSTTRSIWGQNPGDHHTEQGDNAQALKGAMARRYGSPP